MIDRHIYMRRKTITTTDKEIICISHLIRHSIPHATAAVAAATKNTRNSVLYFNSLFYE